MKRNLRFDRSKLLIGTYCLQPYARTEAHIKALADAHIDYICATPNDPALLDICQKYGVGLFAQYLPGWWGGYGENAGTLAQKNTVAEYERLAKEFADHPAIWALDVGDEPSALDFPHYGKLFDAARRLFPNQMPYLNIYPNYGVVPDTTPADVRRQLGTRTYAEYIDQFVQHVDADYICTDYYMYDAGVPDAYRCMAVVADKCRETGRDFWIVLQVNSRDLGVWQSENRLRHQAYAALAFGARAINWACWTAGWWEHNVLDEHGEPTQQYEKLRVVNTELKAMGDEYMRYRSVATRMLDPHDHPVHFDGFSNLTSENALIVGQMENETDRALMICDISDPYDISPAAGHVRFVCKGKVRALCCGKPLPLHREGDAYEFEIRSNQGVLLMTEE